MRKRKVITRPLGALLALTTITALAALTLGFGTAKAVPQTPAAFTTTDPSVDGGGHCKNGNEAVNCNIYDGKTYVWMNGGPVGAGLADGDYFFAVLDPGGQQSPNDGTPGNLSSPNDAYTNRTFHVSGGTITYAGSHDFDSANKKIRLMPYNDTPNPGGVYIMAICGLANGYPVAPKSCKYDAFKVQAGEITTADNLIATKDAAPAFNRTYTWGISKAVDKTEIDIAAGGQATFNYTVTVTHDGGTDGSWAVSGNITVFNPNVGDVTDVTVTDAINDLGSTCSVTGGSGATIPGTSSSSFPYTCTYSAAPSAQSETNTASVNWPQQTVGGLTLAAGSTTGTASVDWSSATPTVVNGSVNVGDSVHGSLSSMSYTETSPKDFKYSETYNGVSGTCTTYPNTASLSGGSTGSASKSVKVCVGADLGVTKSATPAFKRTYTWGISKSVNKTEIDIAAGGQATFNYTVDVTHSTGTDSDWTVTGSITVHNPNDWESINFDLSDAIGNGDSCSITGGGSGLTVAPSSDVTKNYTCTYASAPNPLDGTNTATATWDKTTSLTPHGSASGTASAAFSTTNPTIVNGTVTVNDTLGGNLGSASYTDANPKEFTYSKTFNGVSGTCTTYPNTATYTTNSTGSTGSASQSVKVCVGADLTVTKTASPSFKRTFHWGINKKVDRTQANISSGSAVFNYTIDVTHDTGSDSAWKVTGSITVTNPNDWEDITLSNAGDAIDNGGNCTVDTTAGLTIPKSGSKSYPYSCTYPAAPSPADGTNTGTATWNSATYSTPHGTASGTAAAAFSTTSPSLVDNCVTVTDPNSPNPPLPATVCSTDPSPKTFTYSKSVPAPIDTCVTVPNTAKYTTNTSGATGSSSQSVQVCGPVAGGLTMGFWSNKNGQALESGDGSTGGVCNEGSWLRTFNPFKDLSATATCAQVASYVYNVIKGGGTDCGGATCNPLLKAQMLATALDVYFSSPALGGNKINAPQPIGGVKVNLTAWAGAFSASCETVLKALQDASAASNNDGSVWYSQVKATQVLAKSAFDAINNAIAIACV
jgi:hypothetical protein